MIWFLNTINLPCASFAQAATDRQAQLTKPLGALGYLETLAITLAGHQRRVKPCLEKPHVVVFAADHGVAARGVSAYPQTVTAQMVANFVQGGAAIGVLARLHGFSLSVVDVGVLGVGYQHPMVVLDRAGSSTQCITQKNAMTPLQFETAMGAGLRAVQRASQGGCNVLAGGEMGIGNTTSATALACALLGLPVQDLVGLGTGVDEQTLSLKKRTIDHALLYHANVVQTACPVKILTALGGFEIVALVGAAIACAQQGITYLVDGFIASVAVLFACAINPGVLSWCIFTHESAEQGHRRVLQALQAKPLLYLNMRLGEGSGAAMAIPLLKAACTLHAEMATFHEAGVAQRVENI